MKTQKEDYDNFLITEYLPRALLKLSTHELLAILTFTKTPKEDFFNFLDEYLKKTKELSK